MVPEGGEGPVREEGVLTAKPDLEKTRKLLDSQDMPGVQTFLESLGLDPIDGQQLVEGTKSRFGNPGISVADSLKRQIENLSRRINNLTGQSWRGKLARALGGPYPQGLIDPFLEERKEIQVILNAWNSGEATPAQKYFSQAHTAALEQTAGWMERIETLEMDMRHSGYQPDRLKGQAAEVVKSAADYLTTKSLLKEAEGKAQSVPPQPIGSPPR